MRLNNEDSRVKREEIRLIAAKLREMEEKRDEQGK
jgi:hypothetical protein